MRAATLFSGIGAPECAAPWLDWRWSAEIDPFAAAVHAARLPAVPNLGDVNRIDPDATEPVDLVVFGSPCQSFSVAGKRLGLDDPRGNLALVALRLIGRIRPKWMVFENVPGLLSSDGGRDFGAFLGLMGECGYGFAYRILDAAHAGVPQRRRRVFVVGCLGDWRCPAAVLFEPESLRGDSPPRREAGQDAAGGAGDGSAFSVRPNHHDASWRGDGADNLIGFHPTLRQPEFGNYEDCSPTLRHEASAVAMCLNAHAGRIDGESETFVLRSDAPRSGVAKTPSADAEGRVRLRDPGFNVMTNAAPTIDGGAAHIVAHSLRGEGFDAGEDGTGRGTPIIPVQNATRGKGQNGLGVGGDAMFTLDQASHHAVASAMSVRRLLPVECEKLQGFAPGWTDISYRGKPAADGPRYRALGNSMAVPVIGWVLGRIREVAA